METVIRTAAAAAARLDAEAAAAQPQHVFRKKACAAFVAVVVAAAVYWIGSIWAFRSAALSDTVRAPDALLPFVAPSRRPVDLFRINDAVMGGKSISQLSVRGSAVEFSGESLCAHTWSQDSTPAPLELRSDGWAFESLAPQA